MFLYINMIPYKRYTIESQLSFDEIMGRLNRLTQSENLWKIFPHKKQKYFTGVVSKNSFKIMETSGATNKSVVEGKVTPMGNHTVIKIKVKLSISFILLPILITGWFVYLNFRNDTLTDLYLAIGSSIIVFIISVWSYYNNSLLLKKNLITLFTEATPDKE